MSLFIKGDNNTNKYKSRKNHRLPFFGEIKVEFKNDSNEISTEELKNGLKKGINGKTEKITYEIVLQMIKGTNRVFVLFINLPRW